MLTAGNNTLVCNIGNLAPADGFKSVGFEVILPTVGTNWRAVASARMASPDYDNDQNNTQLDRNFTTTEAADLAIAMAAPASVANGGAFQYVIDVQNKGPSGSPPVAVPWCVSPCPTAPWSRACPQAAAGAARRPRAIR